MNEALLDLTSRIYTDFRFDTKVTTVRTTVEEVFKKRRGVCQDLRISRSPACGQSTSPHVT